MTNKEHFINLIEKHAGIIYKVVNLYADLPEDRKDLYQEVLLQAWKSWEKFRGDSQFSTWLYRVGLNTALVFRKKADKAKKLDHLDKAANIGMENQEEAEELWFAIKNLKEIDRVIISLHLDGYENDAIAEITGLSKNNTAVKLHRIKQIIIDQLKK